MTTSRALTKVTIAQKSLEGDLLIRQEDGRLLPSALLSEEQ